MAEAGCGKRARPTLALIQIIPLALFPRLLGCLPNLCSPCNFFSGYASICFGKNELNWKVIAKSILIHGLAHSAEWNWLSLLSIIGASFRMLGESRFTLK